mmetsp:Transcript_36722/g.105894  ORF Transcript_36722/g.105894 Transcript_36722/m.105894 type:complete len:200 (-) Transcript_36722:1112-1711(-)
MAMATTARRPAGAPATRTPCGRQSPGYRAHPGRPPCVGAASGAAAPPLPSTPQRCRRARPHASRRAEGRSGSPRRKATSARTPSARRCRRRGLRERRCGKACRTSPGIVPSLRSPRAPAACPKCGGSSSTPLAPRRQPPGAAPAPPRSRPQRRRPTAKGCSTWYVSSACFSVAAMVAPTSTRSADAGCTPPCSAAPNPP